MKKILFLLLLAVFLHQSTSFLGAMEMHKYENLKEFLEEVEDPRTYSSLFPLAQIVTSEVDCCIQACEIARYMKHFSRPDDEQVVFPTADDYHLAEVLDTIKEYGAAGSFSYHFIQGLSNKNEYDKYMQWIEEVFLPRSGKQIKSFNAMLCNITQLPPLLEKFTSLRAMNLSGNEGIAIPHLPPSLVMISLKKCALTKVPKALEGCVNLKRINLASNSGIIVPAWLILLPKLSLIDLRNWSPTEHQIEQLQKDCFSKMNIEFRF